MVQICVYKLSYLANRSSVCYASI